MKKAITSFSTRAAALLALMVLTILIAPSEAKAVTVTVVPTDGGTYRVEDNKLYVTPNSEYYLVSVMKENTSQPIESIAPDGGEAYYPVSSDDKITITFKECSRDVHVTFDMNNNNYSGTTPEVQDLTLGQRVSQPTGIAADGNLTVCGWSTNKNGTKPYDFSMRLSNALTYDRNNDYYKLKLYAIWADATQNYTVSFNNNDGNGPMIEDVTQRGGSLYTTPECVFTKRDCAFIGWATSADGDVAFSPGQTIFLTSDLTLYAKWANTIANYVVLFNANGGSSMMAGVAKTDSYTIPECGFTRSGYTFIGWATSADGDVVYQPGQTITLTDNLTLYAKWGINPTVTFDANDGTGTMDPVTLVNGTRYKIPACVFTKDGYDFIGWATSADGAVVYQPGDVITLTDDLTLYAKWGTNPTVTFDANGGTGTMDPVTQAGSYTIPECGYTREGYTFIGWATSDVGNVVYHPGDVITLTDDLTLYAIWAKTTCYVYFNANDGTGTMDPVTQANGTSYDIPACGFTKSGYVFIGWATSPDGAVVYLPMATIMLTDDLTLYAKWAEGIGGPCGLNGSEVTWSLAKSEGSEQYDLLTIISSIADGQIADYEDRECPWYAYRDQIKTIVIGDGVTSIGSNAFKDCTGVISVSFGNSVEYIWDCSFQGCASLTSLNIPSNVLGIGSYAFSGCTGLRSVTIPSNVFAIGSYAFSGCTGLRSVTILSNMCMINDNAFDGCTQLSSVTVYATSVPECFNNVFDNNADGRKIYVPAAKVNDYKNASGWRNYADDILPIGTVSYIDADGNMAYCSNYVEVTIDLPEFNDNTWYVVNSDVLMSNSIQVLGEVSLILCDGVTLTLNLISGNSGNDKITIYGQSGGSGTLKSDNRIELKNVSLIINGGSVTASDGGAAIFSSGGDVVINGGSVTANSDGGYAIYSNRGNVVINGGSVTATSLIPGNAIYSDNGNVVINGGTVMTEGTRTIGCSDGHTVTIAEQMIDCTSGSKRVITESIDGNMATALQTFFGDGASVSASFKRTFKENVASTLCLPFSFTPTSGKCYEFTSVDENWETVTMTEVLTSTANTPHIYKSAVTGEQPFSGTVTCGSTTADVTTVGDWTFTGTYVEKRWDANNNPDGRIFGFATGQGYEGTAASTAAGVFIRLTTGGIKPFRAYLKYTGSLARTRGEGGLPETMTVRLVNANGEIQGIGEIKLDTGEVTFDSNAWYDLNGRRLDGKPSEKGIYINGGRKVVIK